jgi:hypothetical protein
MCNLFENKVIKNTHVCQLMAHEECKINLLSNMVLQTKQRRHIYNENIQTNLTWASIYKLHY